MGIIEKTKNAFNSFRKKEELIPKEEIGYSSGYGGAPVYRAHRYSKGSISDTILTRIAIDVSELEFYHVKMDNDPKTEEIMQSGLQRIFELEANIDQTSNDFIQDLVYSMLDEGVVSAAPVHIKPEWSPYVDVTASDIITMRTGKVTRWQPSSVELYLFNELENRYDTITYSKRNVAIIQNPLYAVFNADNACMKRLMRKLQLIDTVDEKNSSAKLNIILQTPYATKSSLQQDKAKKRVGDVEAQLQDSPYGIAYIGAEEKITQLGRPIDNNLLQEIKDLKEELYSTLGLTKAIFDGTANEAELTNYYNRTIIPIANRICKEFSRKFITETGRTQGQTVVFYTNPMKLVAASQIASMGDTLRRNEIATTNEIRKFIGLRPSDNPKANELFNPNMPNGQDTGTMPEGTIQTFDENGNPQTVGGDGGEAGGEQEENADEVFNQLNQQQIQQLLEYIQELTGSDLEGEELLSTLSDEQLNQVIQKAKELLGQNG